MINSVKTLNKYSHSLPYKIKYPNYNNSLSLNIIINHIIYFIHNLKTKHYITKKYYIYFF